jgi:hypothetical protein
MISLIIPTTTKNRRYTDYLVESINQSYPTSDNIEIIVEENDNVTLGINYNNAVSKANGNKIILLHNDMVIKHGFVELMDKHIVKNRITTYTRIEPPIYPDTYPGKVVLDFGYDLDSFDKESFNQLNVDESLIDGGSQLFFGCMKEDWIGIDGYTFKLFCEDDDLHLRYKIAGFEQVVSSAHLYHFVSKTSRISEDYKSLEYQSNLNFIKKWGFRNSVHNKVYKKSFKLKNPNDRLIQILEIWFNDGEDVIVEIDGNTFTQHDFEYIQQLNDIIFHNNELGQFQLGNMILHINSLKTYEADLIKLT